MRLPAGFIPVVTELVIRTHAAESAASLRVTERRAQQPGEPLALIDVEAVEPEVDLSPARSLTESAEEPVPPGKEARIVAVSFSSQP